MPGGPVTEVRPKHMRTLATKKRPIKVGVLVSHPIQYFVPVYRALAQNPEITLSVIYRTRTGVDAYHDAGFGRLVKWDIPLLDGYRSQFLSDKTELRSLEPRVVTELLRERFDVLIVHGYNSGTNLLGIAVALLTGARVIIRGDTRLQQHHLRARAWKQFFKRKLFKVFDGFLSIGTLNKEYYASFGAEPDRIFFAPFCVNNASFSVEASGRSIGRQQFRLEFGLPADCVVILFASKLTARKRPADLLAAYANLAQQHPDAWLIMAGSGEQEQTLKTAAAALGLERVRFVGFQNQSALPNLYAASDIFVLPSEQEPWGLVVNEAMAAGLPVIVSDEVGAAPDLVQGQGTGIVYRCGDVAALTRAMESLLQSAQKRQEMGAKGQELVRAWDVDKCVSGIVSAVQRVL